MTVDHFLVTKPNIRKLTNFFLTLKMLKYVATFYILYQIYILHNILYSIQYIIYITKRKQRILALLRSFCIKINK